MKKSEKLRKTFDESIEKLIDAVESESVTQELKDFYKQVSRFTQYSLRNQILITVQDEKATRVAGYKAWKKFNRYVMKGEHGISILAPHTYKTIDDKGIESDRIGFHATTVFDVRQTDGEPLIDPTSVTGDDGGDLWDVLVKYSTNMNMPIIIDDLGTTDGLCTKKDITIDSKLSMQSRIGVIVHELAHHLAGHVGSGESSKIKEYVAESVAFIFCERFGIKNKAPQYLKHWGATRDNIKSSLTVISKISSEIINEVEKATKSE